MTFACTLAEFHVSEFSLPCACDVGVSRVGNKKHTHKNFRDSSTAIDQVRISASANAHLWSALRLVQCTDERWRPLQRQCPLISRSRWMLPFVLPRPVPRLLLAGAQSCQTLSDPLRTVN
jgi:hypothetical protein